MEEDEEELYSEMQLEEGRRRNTHNTAKVHLTCCEPNCHNHPQQNCPVTFTDRYPLLPPPAFHVWNAEFNSEDRSISVWTSLYVFFSNRNRFLQFVSDFTVRAAHANISISLFLKFLVHSG